MSRLCSRKRSPSPRGKGRGEGERASVVHKFWTDRLDVVSRLKRKERGVYAASGQAGYGGCEMPTLQSIF
jgi:hypothetical protein